MARFKLHFPVISLSLPAVTAVRLHIPATAIQGSWSCTLISIFLKLLQLAASENKRFHHNCVLISYSIPEFA